jgi:hypothetical protein
LLAYLVVSALSVLAGITLSKLLRMAPESEWTLFCAPVLTLSFWVLAVAAGLGLGLPIHATAPAIIAITLLLAAFGATRIRPLWHWHLALCWLPPIVVEWRAFLVGLNNYNITGGYDTHLYISCAHAYWRYLPASLNDSMGAIYQIARSQVTLWRHGASTIMALFSYVYRAGDTQQSLGLFVVFGLFALGCATYAVCQAFGLPTSAPWRTGVAVVVTVLSGWIANIIIEANLDQFICLPCGLLLMAVVRRQGAGVLPAALGLAVAVLVAYPDYFPVFVAQGVALYVVMHASAFRPSPRVLLVLAVLLACSWVPLRPIILYRLHTAMSPTSTIRLGGDAFKAMLQPATVTSALWGTGVEWGVERATSANLAVSLVWSAWFLVALVVRLRQRDWPFFAAFGVPAAGMAYALGVCSYPYLAYKFLVILWPLVCLLLVDHLAMVSRRAARNVGFVLLLALVAIAQLRFNGYGPNVPRAQRTEPYWPPYRALETALRPDDPGAVLVCVDDGSSSINALYFLRDHPVVVGVPVHHEAIDFIKKLIDASSVANIPRIGYLLLEPHSEYKAALRYVSGPPVFTSARYELYKLRPDWTLLPLSDPPPFPWPDSAFKFYNRGTSTLDIAGEVEGSPPGATLQVLLNDQPPRPMQASQGKFSFSLPLESGPNSIKIEMVTPPHSQLRVTAVTPR